jgi:hypothetical protein
MCSGCHRSCHCSSQRLLPLCVAAVATALVIAWLCLCVCIFICLCLCVCICNGLTSNARLLKLAAALLQFFLELRHSSRLLPCRLLNEQLPARRLFSRWQERPQSFWIASSTKTSRWKSSRRMTSTCSSSMRTRRMRNTTSRSAPPSSTTSPHLRSPLVRRHLGLLRRHPPSSSHRPRRHHKATLRGHPFRGGQLADQRRRRRDRCSRHLGRHLRRHLRRHHRRALRRDLRRHLGRHLRRALRRDLRRHLRRHHRRALRRDLPSTWAGPWAEGTPCRWTSICTCRPKQRSRRLTTCLGVNGAPLLPRQGTPSGSGGVRLTETEPKAERCGGPTAEGNTASTTATWPCRAACGRRPEATK